MTATLAPFGGRPIYNPSGPAPRASAYPDAILSTYTSNIYNCAPVKWNSSGVIVVATSNDDIIGFFGGCNFSQTASPIPKYQPYWVSGDSYIAGTMKVFIWDNPTYIYEIQCGGSLAQTAIGDQANFLNPQSGNSLYFSNATITSTLAGASNTGQLRIVGLSEMVDNAWGDAYTIVKVQIAAQQTIAIKAAI